jgi:PHD/YefM family antitoxin component YafN of YafNO toxin-antitoxin module
LWTTEPAREEDPLRLLRSEGIPFIDPNVERVGVSKLRTLNASNLGHVNKTIVIQDNDKPLAVLLNYEQYMAIQNKLQEALDTLELLSKTENASALLSGLKDITEGRVSPLTEVDPQLKVK